MADVLKIASYIAERYKRDFKERIDEMKLHKLLYFTQREALIQTDAPMFDASFYGWKYGPVLLEIREGYRNDTLHTQPSEETIKKYQEVFDKIFEHYAVKDSWSLSRLSHGELSWKNARIGLLPSENGNVKMKIEDIRKDAERIKMRRYLLKEMALIS
jgi:uncharacterized phage-associated protein